MAKHISVKGVIQGVGFRPFVYGLATRLDLHGWVCSTPAGVEIFVDGQIDAINTFIESLRSQKPPLARIDSLQVQDAPHDSLPGFEIRESPEVEDRDWPVCADIAICPDCERELFQPTDKRYLYPFISCTQCGPRLTIIRDVPYVRANTTMASFLMCDSCRAEYLDPHNRRFHVQPIACPDCGPFVELRETHSQFPTSDPRVSSIEIRVSAILKARRLLREGYIVAVKSLGGFHLACDAANPYTLAELRDRKGRSDKPFPVMAANLAMVTSICHMQQEDHRLLTGREKPIVLLAKKQQSASLGYRVSELVAPNLDSLGVMLPSTPLHHLLINQTDPVLAREPVPPILVMTGSDSGEEPMVTDNKDALEKLSPLADAFLLHNRDIHVRSDDSVVRVHRGKTIFLRRSRGYAPYPVELPGSVSSILAVGGQLKNTFCLARGRRAFLSHYIGDLENAETYESFEQGVQHLSRLLGVEPEIVAHDLNPDYFTTHYAERTGLPRLGIQHHHAHIAACMADNELKEGSVIGLAFDGAGYGTDGAVWGGEVLLSSYAGFERFAHLEYLPLPGADTASPSPWRVAAGYAHALGLDVDRLPFAQNLDRKTVRGLKRQIDRRLNSPLTSSMGRLFDAVSSLAGIRTEVSYEGQAAIEMETLSRAFVADGDAYPYTLEETGNIVLVRLEALLAAIVRDVHRGRSVGRIGADFHKTVAEIAIQLCNQARHRTGIREVVLSGGVWQNQILLDLVCDGLMQKGFLVYSHKQIPTNDGGLAFGQAAIASFQAFAHNGQKLHPENTLNPRQV